MGCCYELTTGCCGSSVRNTACIAFWSYIIFGSYITAFVFTNTCYPPFYIPDYSFGGSGAALTVISFLAACTIDLKKCQALRAIMGLLVVLSYSFTVVSCYYYTIVRWDDVMVTLLTKTIRSNMYMDEPDFLWFTLVIINCVISPFFLIYLIYVASFMFHEWKSHLFTSGYANNEFFSALPPTMTIPKDSYSTRNYKPYPVQVRH
ncbi:hypothetical protein RUM43_000398 [Polyplax serrata]|uniref:Uncharacterized protein n=1 Tax=Polyplax serrata TaxID=468196 RepID=A0AAN8SFW0_POLSC